MHFVACIAEQVERLVHPVAQDRPLERARHRSFIATRFLVSIAAVAAAPAYLAAGNVPGIAHAIAFAFLLVPLVAVSRVAKTGQLVEGEILSLATWIGLALSLVLGRICGVGPAIALLCVAMIEASSSDHSRVMRGGLAATLSAGALILVWACFGNAPPAPARFEDPIFYAVALAYGGVVTAESARIRRWFAHRVETDERRRRAIAQALGDLVLHLDRSGSVLLASDSAERLFKVKASDLKGRGFFDRLNVADRPAFLKLIGDAANGPEATTGTLRLRTTTVPSEDGRYQEPVFAWVEVRAKSVGTEPSSAVGTSLIAVIRDVTTRMAHEAAIERAKREAEEASAWKDRFLATVTHELRTPLNAIIGFGEILANNGNTTLEAGKRQEYASIIHQSGEHLLTIVNSLLDLSKIDAGRFELIFEPFDIAAIVHACCDLVGLKAEQAQIRLVRQVLPSCEMAGDARACRRILINLLSNALKFTPAHGQVTVSLEADSNSVRISVGDTGVGMSEADLTRLGNPFFQGQNGTDRLFEGTGLGLSVVSGLVGLHAGTISVESEPGEGTRMSVSLPRHVAVMPSRCDRATIEVIARAPPRDARARNATQIKVQKIA